MTPAMAQDCAAQVQRARERAQRTASSTPAATARALSDIARRDPPRARADRCRPTLVPCVDGHPVGHEDPAQQARRLRRVTARPSDLPHHVAGRHQAPIATAAAERAGGGRAQHARLGDARARRWATPVSGFRAARPDHAAQRPARAASRSPRARRGRPSNPGPRPITSRGLLAACVVVRASPCARPPARPAAAPEARASGSTDHRRTRRRAAGTRVEARPARPRTPSTSAAPVKTASAKQTRRRTASGCSRSSTTHAEAGTGSRAARRPRPSRPRRGRPAGPGARPGRHAAPAPSRPANLSRPGSSMRMGRTAAGSTPRRTAIISASTLTAISSGVTAPISTPSGQWMRASPRAARRAPPARSRRAPAWAGCPAGPRSAARLPTARPAARPRRRCARA